MGRRHSEVTPIQGYLERLHARLAGLEEGEVASYIPELARADPKSFGIALVTVDGHVYQVGDSRLPFTVQSISKAIVYGMALEDCGMDGVFRKVGVEPSGEAFNSISLEPVTGRPLNPMINAGAIATTGLVTAASRQERLATILRRFGKYTGHAPSINDAVYRSERDTGHRNRAIAHLLRNADIIGGDPEEVLDSYFQQCSIEVTARDLALIGACLANSGINPVTGVVALEQRYVEKVLSVMSTCGMYDYSGSWVFNVGMPAKSGVGGGIMAVLPGQFGLGIFSPLLDAKGNSVRGIRVCEALSHDYNLHLFKVARASSGSVLRLAYDASKVGSRRRLREPETATLREHGRGIRVYELQGQLMFASTDSVVSAILGGLDDTRSAIVDLRRVVDIDRASLRLLADFARALVKLDTPLFFSGTASKFGFRRALERIAPELDCAALLQFADLDRALEWCEDLLLRDHACATDREQALPLEAQQLCQELDADALARLSAICHPREFAVGETLFRAGERAQSLFMILSGVVDIVVKGNGRQERRLNTTRAGMATGELAMVTGGLRSAEARAITRVRCAEVFFDDIDDRLKTQLLACIAKDLASRLAREASQYQVLGGE